MELDAEQVAGGHDAAEALAVFGGGEGHRRMLGAAEIGMDEIEPLARTQASGQSRRPELDGVPSDLGNLAFLREFHDVALDETQTSAFGVFLVVLKEHLHAHANAQQRFARFSGCGDGFGETVPAQVADAVAESAHSRQDDFVGVLQTFGTVEDAVFDTERVQGVL